MVILSCPKIFRDLLKLLQRFQHNFNLRHLIALENQESVNAYLSNLYDFTIQSFQCNQA
jgi:hypothetical protein